MMKCNRSIHTAKSMRNMRILPNGSSFIRISGGTAPLATLSGADQVVACILDCGQFVSQLIDYTLLYLPIVKTSIELHFSSKELRRLK